MAKSVNDRFTTWLDKHRAGGAKRTSVLLYPETVKQLADFLSSLPAESQTSIINKAIAAYYVSANNNGCNSSASTVGTNKKTKKTSPINIHIKPGQKMRHDLVMELHKKGLSCQAIADELKKRGIPTAYGYQKWQRRVVSKIIKQHSPWKYIPLIQAWACPCQRWRPGSDLSNRSCRRTSQCGWRSHPARKARVQTRACELDCRPL